MSVRHTICTLVAVVGVPCLVAMDAKPIPEYGIQGCALYPDDEFCISVRAANRQGTVHGKLAPECATSAAARPSIEEGTELAIAMMRGKVGDLAFQLSCLLELKGGVTALPDVSQLSFASLHWQGLLGRQPAGPIPTREGRDVWIVLKEEGRRLEISGRP